MQVPVFCLCFLQEDEKCNQIHLLNFKFILFLQGVIIFYLYCLRRDNIRKLWLPHKVGVRKVLSSSTATGETATTEIGYKWQFPKSNGRNTNTTKL